MKLIFTLVIFLSCTLSCLKCINFNFEEQRQQFIKNISLEKGSNCMKEVIKSFINTISDDQITSNIKQTTQNGIDENLKAKIAIQLTNCHFERSSRPLVECNDSMKIKECTLDLLSKDQKGWQQNTEFLIDSLYLASEQLKNEINLYNNSFSFSVTVYYCVLIATGFICGLSSQTKNARSVIYFLAVINFCIELYISNVGVALKDQNIFKRFIKIEIIKKII